MLSEPSVLGMLGRHAHSKMQHLSSLVSIVTEPDQIGPPRLVN